jgi:hypothetical protein
MLRHAPGVRSVTVTEISLYRSRKHIRISPFRWGQPGSLSLLIFHHQECIRHIFGQKSHQEPKSQSHWHIPMGFMTQLGQEAADDLGALPDGIHHSTSGWTSPVVFASSPHLKTLLVNSASLASGRDIYASWEKTVVGQIISGLSLTGSRDRHLFGHETEFGKRQYTVFSNWFDACREILRNEEKYKYPIISDESMVVQDNHSPRCVDRPAQPSSRDLLPQTSSPYAGDGLGCDRT